MADPRSRNRLLVEGRDDKHSVIHLLKARGVDWDAAPSWVPYIEDREGFDSLRTGLSTTLFQSVDTLGIVIDADDTPADRWSSISDALHSYGFDPPPTASPSGWIGSSSGFRPCRCGVRLMPDNVGRGILEDFLALLVPANDGCWSHACDATTEAKRIGAAYPLSAESKARLHTWLAWQERPGQPLGQTITHRYLKPDSPSAQPFIDWFHRLFRDSYAAPPEGLV